MKKDFTSKREKMEIYRHNSCKKIPDSHLAYFKTLRDEFKVIDDPLFSKNKFYYIKKKNPNLKSIFIAIENLRYEFFRRKEYVKITRRKIPSILKQKMYELASNNEFNMLANKLCRKFKGDEFDKCVEKLVKKRYYQKALTLLKAEYQVIYPRSWKKKLKDIYRERWKFYYKRRCEMKPLFEFMDWRNDWLQIFIIEHKKGIYWDMGGSASTWKRLTQKEYGGLFCDVQRKLKDIPTFVYWYDSENNFLYLTKRKKLLICPKEIWEEKIMEEINKIKFEQDFMNHENSIIKIFYS